MADNDEQLAAPSKEQLEQEKQLLLAFKPVMQKFLHDHTELQVSALYALQVHCNARAFPKGNHPSPPSSLGQSTVFGYVAERKFLHYLVCPQESAGIQKMFNVICVVQL